MLIRPGEVTAGNGRPAVEQEQVVGEGNAREGGERPVEQSVTMGDVQGVRDDSGKEAVGKQKLAPPKLRNGCHRRLPKHLQDLLWTYYLCAYSCPTVMMNTEEEHQFVPDYDDCETSVRQKRKLRHCNVCKILMSATPHPWLSSVPIYLSHCLLQYWICGFQEDKRARMAQHSSSSHVDPLFTDSDLLEWVQLISCLLQHLWEAPGFSTVTELMSMLLKTSFSKIRFRHQLFTLGSMRDP